MSETVDWDDHDDFDEDWVEEDDEYEMVLDCGLEGCLMPGEHMRCECHTVQMVEDAIREAARAERMGRRCPDGDWVGDREPGGMECIDCGCIFISNDGRPRCKVCHAEQIQDLDWHSGLPVPQSGEAK